ncbi:hypothetical protein DP662_002096 [Escherichia coli]|nr:hypothetical protein [Escherichia coli]EFB4148188.1 hypothetical protein [Escherichia coli O128]EER5772113.1 hypothetical protein [Escherichia coli]EET1394048.1 hypothetical protein [Escherichia coli]EET5251358.1 hypothetical protein [Escherichia coli]
MLLIVLNIVFIVITIILVIMC